MTVQPIFPDTLRALSIAGPYAYEIAIGNKPSEGRTWRTNFRGLVLLHVSTGREYGEPQSQEMVSAIIGAAEVYNCTQEEWVFHHWMKNPILFEQFVPNVSGARNYWSPRTSAHVVAFNQAWEQIQKQQPRAMFRMQYKDGTINISNNRTANAFQVKDDGIWQTLYPRIEHDEIELTKLEYADLYRKRLV